MESANPYAPPRAAVADVDEGPVGTAPVRVWSSQGRVGRLRYIAHLMGGYLVLLAFMVVCGLLAGMSGSEWVVATGTAVGVIAYLWFFALKTVQRSHDMDWSGWTCLLALIPFVGLIWWFKGGTPRGNRYGLPPPPNTGGVKALALLLPAIAIIGLVAAMALPAYKDYTERARAAQVK